MDKVKIFSNTATTHLFNQIQDSSLIASKGELKVSKFSDGEISVKFMCSIRGCNVFIFADTAQNLTELLLTLDAAKRASASSVTVILPYYGYGRQDKREGTRGSIGAKMVANVLTALEVDRIVSIDLHADQIQGFFNIPVEHIKGHTIFLDYLRQQDLSNTVLCAPDAGGVGRVNAYSKKLDLRMVTMNKHREKPNEVASIELMGDVAGKDVVVIDDMVDTAGTMVKASEYLKQKGALSVSYIATHAVLSGEGRMNVVHKADIKHLITSDTVQRDMFASKIKVISCVPVLQKVIHNIIMDGSISNIND